MTSAIPIASSSCAVERLDRVVQRADDTEVETDHAAERPRTGRHVGEFNEAVHHQFRIGVDLGAREHLLERRAHALERLVQSGRVCGGSTIRVRGRRGLAGTAPW